LIVTLREYNVATRYIDGPFSPLLNQAVTDKAAIADNITMNINSGNCSKADERTGTGSLSRPGQTRTTWILRIPTTIALPLTYPRCSF
jgi:hypothetical protein